MNEKYFDKKLKLDYIFSFIGQICRIALQGLFMLLLAYYLGKQEFGIYSLLFSIAILISPFSNFSSNTLLVKSSITQKNEISFIDRLIKSQLITLFFGTVVILVSSYIVTFVYEFKLSLILLLLLSEVLLSRLFENVLAHFQAKEEYRVILLLKILMPLVKISSLIIVLVSSHNFDFEFWCLVYLTSILAFVMSVLLILFTREMKEASRKGVREFNFHYKEGFFISCSLLAHAVFTTTDQLMLGYFKSAVLVAEYAFYARLSFMFMLPMQSIAIVNLKKFCDRSINPIPMIKATAKITLAYSFLVIAMVTSLSGYLLGEYLPEYSENIYVLIGLVLLLPIKGVTLVLADYVLGIGLVKKRVSAEMSICFVNIILNMFMIPKFGMYGALATTIICEVLLLSFLSLLSYRTIYGSS